MKENRPIMIELHNSGLTYETIGRSYGISRQRVYQIIRDHTTRKNARIKAEYGITNCQVCKVSAKKVRLEVHHKDKNTKNNDRSNIQIVCRKCHLTIETLRTDCWVNLPKQGYSINKSDGRIRPLVA